MRKNLLLSLLSCLLLSLVQAQVKKDSWLLGGQISFGSIKTAEAGQEEQSKGGLFQLSAGKAYRQNHVVGGQLSGQFSEQVYFNGLEDVQRKTRYYGAGVFYRLYKNLGKDFYFFGQANADFLWGKGREEYASLAENRTTNSFRGSLSVTPGIAYAVFPKFHVELILPGLFGLSYDRTTSAYPNAGGRESVTTGFRAYTSLDDAGQAGILGIGFRVVL